jgi:hypothetical protein
LLPNNYSYVHFRWVSGCSFSKCHTLHRCTVNDNSVWARRHSVSIFPHLVVQVSFYLLWGLNLNSFVESNLHLKSFELNCLLKQASLILCMKSIVILQSMCDSPQAVPLCRSRIHHMTCSLESSRITSLFSRIAFLYVGDRFVGTSAINLVVFWCRICFCWHVHMQRIESYSPQCQNGRSGFLRSWFQIMRWDIWSIASKELYFCGSCFRLG